MIILNVPSKFVPFDDAQAYRTYLDALIENIPVAVVVLDAQHHVATCNPSFEKLFQYSNYDLTGKSLDELITTPHFRAEAAAFTRRVLRGEKVHAVTQRFRKDGAMVNVELYGVPLILNGRVNGVYALYQDVTELNRVETELRRLSARFLQLQDEERRRIARELHDTTSQELAVLGLKLHRLKLMVSSKDRFIRNLVGETIDLAKQCSREIRSTSYLLHPPLLEEAGLKPAVAWFAGGFEQRSGIQVNLSVSPRFGRLPHEVEMAFFRVVQEGLSNVLRHSGSSVANIHMRRVNDRVSVEIADRGKGFHKHAPEPKAKTLGVGILGMRERLQQLGGYLDVAFTNHGTTVTASLPLKVMKHGKPSHSDC